MKPRRHHPLCIHARLLRQAGLLLAATLSLGTPTAQTLTLGAGTGGTVRALLGVNAGPLAYGDAGTADQTTNYRRYGVNLVRNHDFYGPLDMSTLYPDPSKDPGLLSAYNFSAVLSADDSHQSSSDRSFAGILDGGFEPYFRIGDSYNNVKPPSRANLDNWAKATVQVLKHYRQGQWNGFVSRFRYVEVGNEPDNEQFWPKPLTITDFNLLYEKTAPLIRAAFPEMSLGGPGFAPSACLSSEGQGKVRSWLEHVKTHQLPLDFVSFHVYATEVADYVNCAAFYRTELDQRGYAGVPLHITEWNTPNGAPGSAAAQLRYDAQGAAYLSAVWITLQNIGVAESTFFRGADPTLDQNWFYGLFQGNGKAKKIAEAFALWRDLSAYGQTIAVSGDLVSGHAALAAQHDNGAKALLLANPQASAASYTLALAGGGRLSDYRISVATVSDAASSSAAVAQTSARIALPAQSVVLVRLTPVANTFVASARLDANGLQLSLAPAAVDLGRPGAVYWFALAGNQIWSYNGVKWEVWDGRPEVTPSRLGNQPPAFSASVFSASELAPLKNLYVFASYGDSLQEMLATERYRLVFSQP